jgi:hypothetical protein
LWPGFFFYVIERRKNGYDFLTKFNENPLGALKIITVDVRRW